MKSLCNGSEKRKDHCKVCILFYSFSTNRKLISLCPLYFLFVQLIVVPCFCVNISFRFWQLIEACKQNRIANMFFGVLAGHLGIDNLKNVS